MNTSSKSLVTGLRRLQLSSELIPQPCFQGFSATKTPGNEVVFTLSNEFLVSKETVVLRRWERSKQKFGFIKRVDKG